jgi:aryl-alcohol dehydrogenase-like predicted oxidoreductase
VKQQAVKSAQDTDDSLRIALYKFIDGVAPAGMNEFFGLLRGRKLNFLRPEFFARTHTMQYINFGKTGLKVSRICLGCMSYGVPERGPHLWTLPEDVSRPFIKAALDAGINFFDTANVYSDGTSEEIVGRALRDFGRRDEIVLATKVHGLMRKDPNGKGLSRKAIMTEIDHSLRRLGTDYVDLYQTHRWDYETPIEETLEALHDVVKAGKARYIGASSMYAWQFAKALYLAERHGWTRFVSMQNHYNLIYREEEREMMKLCLEEQIAVIPWSPLARGKLTRASDSLGTERSATDEFGKTLYKKSEEADKIIIDRVGEVATARGISRAQVALAWMLGKPYITSPIIGATKPNHLSDAVSALEVTLTAEEVAKLEEPYVPHAVSGFA